MILGKTNLCEVFSKSVDRTPHALAVDHGDGCLTYSQLDVASSIVAQNIQRLGAKHGSTVLLMSEHGTLNAVAMLAILKTGASFVPIDQGAWSHEKISYVMAIVDWSIIVKTTRQPFPLPASRDVLHLKSIPQFDQTPLRPEQPNIKPEDIACVIFTSGSTGKPKGVVLTHDAFSLYARTSLFNMDVRPGDRVLHILSVAFDAYICVFFSTIGNSGTVVPAQLEDVHEKAPTCSIIAATPSILATLPRPSCGNIASAYPVLHTVLLGGETAPQNLLHSWLDTSVRVLNGYGPCETTCTGTIQLVERDKNGRVQAAIIGQPMAATPVYLIDEDLNIIENDGTDGEIVIGGRSLATGYYKDESRTAQTFITWKGTRIYRTGDFGRWAQSRQKARVLEFRGRRDRTVKNRGFLVNLEADVEVPLQKLGSKLGIQDVHAMMFKGRLIAVVRPECTHVNGLIRMTRAQLCSYQTPNQIEVVPDFPLSANGKIHPEAMVRMLEDIEAARVQDPQPSAISASTEEACAKFDIVAACVAEALGLSSTRRRPDENFFKLGAQSLTALQVVSLARARGLCITVRHIYSFPTIGALASQATVLEASVQPSLDTSAPFSEADLKAEVREYLGLENDQFEVGVITQLQLQLALPTLEHDGLNTNQLHLTYSLEDATTAENAWTRLWYLEPIFRTKLLLHLRNGVEVIYRQPFRHPSTATYSSMEQYTRAVKEVPLTVSLSSSLNFFHFVPPSNSPETGEVTVVLTVHHSLMDGHSVSVLLQRVSKIAQGVQPAPSLSLPQAKLDLIGIQNERNMEAKTFWEDYLKSTTTRDAKASTITLYENMVARPRERRLDYFKQIGSLEQLAAECHVTRAAVYYTAWAAALSEQPADDMVVVGAVFSGREPLLAHQDTVGTFISTLPLVVELKEEFSVTEQLQSTMKGLSQISQYTWTRPNQIPSQPDNLLAVQPCISFSEQLPTPLKSRTYENSAFPLSLLVDEKDGQFRLMYNHKVISDKIAALIGNKFQAYLNSLLRRGSVTTQSLSANAITQNSSGVYPSPQQRPRTVALAFVESARCHADLYALEDATKTMTYATLDANADIVAHEIRHRTPLAKTVAIYGDGTMEWCVALLGALKAGCTYCPLDPNWSPEFKASVFERSGSGALIVSSSDQRRILPTDGVEVIVVDEALRRVDLLTRVRLPEATVSSDDNFIIVFTSGTTGVSKGVPITHRSFLALQSYPEATMFSRPGHRIAQFMSPAFDVCANEVFSAFLHGGTLVLKDVEDPYAHLGRVDAATITPSVMGVLDPDKFPNLSIVYATGEPVTPALVDLFGPGRQFYNAYGPAEAGIWASFTKLAPGDKVTIGHGLRTARMYLLDSNLQSANEGEIFIAGEQVMRGYIGSSEETAKRIMADPWNQNDRMYRTGDYGRRLEAGSIEYIGRLDRMVKIRGFRVELPGIEQMIYSLDTGVVLAAALHIEERLVTFVKPSTVDIRALRINLTKNLPSAWVPHYIIPTDDIPTTANKKTDFRALATLVSHEQLGREIQKVYVPLESEQEAQVAREWRQILKLDSKVPLSANDHFLRLGGHSVLQILLAERLSRISGVKISVRDVIQAPILADQAALLQRLSQQDQTIHETIHPILRAKQPSKPTTVSEGQLSELEEQVWFQYQMATNVTAFNIGTIVNIHGTFERGRLVAALNAALSSQPIFRSNFVEHDQGPRRKLRETPPRVREVGCLDYNKVVNTPFDLAADELIRTFLVSGQKIFVCTTHAIADLNSIQSFLHFVSAAYAKPTDVVPTALSSYIDSEVWERQATKVEKTFWREYLRGWPQSLKLARQPTVGMFEGQSRLRHFNRALVSSLEQRVRRVGVTKHQLVLAALAQTLYWLTGQADIVLGAPFVNRPTSIERDSVGLFLEKVPVRLQKEQLHLRDTSSPVSALLRAAQNSSQQAVAHAIPFSELLDLVDIRSTTAPSRHPIFECVVTFHLQDAVTRCLNIPGCTVTSGPPCFGQGSKFLLMCEWTENADGTWALRIEHDSCRIQPTVIDAMERCLDIVLGAFAEDCMYIDLRSQLEHVTAPRLSPWKLEDLSALITHEMESCSQTKESSFSESFFSAGADSLVALKLRRRLLRHGIDVSLRTIMHLQNSQQLAECLVRWL